MDVMTLMAQFSDPETLKNLSLTQKLTASMITTFLGMGITFIALIILQIVIGLLARFTAEKRSKETVTAVQPAMTAENEQHRDEELVAAITVALSLQLGTGVGNIVIRNIQKIEDHSPAWNRVGLAELMNNNA
jgi:sodium pump decarboxylase gamma subunit